MMSTVASSASKRCSKGLYVSRSAPPPFTNTNNCRVNDLLSRTHGHTLFDNSQTVYGSALYPAPYYAAVNQGITRYTETPDALAWLDHNYEPTGDLEIPMITVHKTRDRLVPYRHEAAYRARVIAAGASANLIQRSQDAFGHCDFGVSDMLSNFQDLVRWVDTGVKP